MTVHGFQDSPISWKNWEHGYQDHGDNVLTLLVFPNQDYWLYLALGSQDEFT